MADPLFRNSPYQDKSRSRSKERSHTDRRGRHGESPASSPSGLLTGEREKERESSDDARPAPRPQKSSRSGSDAKHTNDEPESRSSTRAFAGAREHLSELANQLSERLAPAEHKVALGITVVALILVGIGLAGMFAGSKSPESPVNTPPWEGQEGGQSSSHGHLRTGQRHGSSTREHHHQPNPAAPLQPLPQCSDMVPCPVEWRRPGHEGGYFCLTTGKCQKASSGRFPSCDIQCHVGALKEVPPRPAQGQGDHEGQSGNQGSTGNTVIVIQGSASTGKDKALTPLKLEKSGAYDLRVMKGGKMIGCAAPIGLFPGQPKYGCGGNYSTATSCDAANFPVKDTKYVAAVHQGCETEAGRGTYGYAYDDGVGLKQCAPVAKYEWVLCPTGREGNVEWEAEAGHQDTTKRFRVTNKCKETIWIQQAGAQDAILKHDKTLVKLEAGSHYTYSIPNRGFPSTRFLPKTGCDSDGNGCDIQSMPPCPPQGCDLPVDTKFEASWGCIYATGIPFKDSERCALTGQGNPSTYQDWWDGSAVDGWTLPFSVLVDDAGHGLAPGDTSGSPAICGPVVCANLKAEELCPREEYLTPTA